MVSCVLAAAFLLAPVGGQEAEKQQRVYLDIVLPQRDATLEIDGNATKQTGARRLFVSPPLKPGRTFVYKLTATWEPNNYTKITRTRRVSVQAGQELEVDLRKADLRIFRASINDINGGSIRCYACHASNSAYGTPNDRTFLTRLRIAEFQMELDTSEPYAAFERRIGGLKWDLSKLLFDIRAKAQRVHIYGASTKGNVLLQWYGVNRLTVDCAADRNPQKVGSRTLGTEIPIVSEAESRAQKPDYYLVLPWHFRKEFLQREKDTILAGTKMIFPLPQIEVVSAANYAAALASAEGETGRLADLMFAKGSG